MLRDLNLYLKKMNKFIISENQKIKFAINLMNKLGERCLLVCDKKKLLGTLSTGDIRKNLLKKIDIRKENVSKIYNRRPTYLMHENFSYEKAKEIFITKKSEILPILNKKKHVIDIIFSHDVLKRSNKKIIYRKDVAAVIMAGGYGTRLEPITHILPKPLVPINNIPIIERIMQNFLFEGINKFVITVHYKAKLLEAFFHEISKEKKVNIKLVKESKPLGTAGALKKLSVLKKDFFLINCDTLIKYPFFQILKAHKHEKNAITIVTVKKKFQVPFGICETDINNNLKSIVEKPVNYHNINIGLYVISPIVKKFIPKNKKIDMDVLIKNLIKKKIKIGVYNINEKNWSDVGEWTSYNLARKQINDDE